jgi:hypothetical protein
MSDTVTDQAAGKEWVSVPELALRRGVATRTVERWIEKGRIETRLDPEGRRQVVARPVSGRPPGRVSPYESHEPDASPAGLTGVEHARLKAEIEGARTAAKIHARRADEAREEGARVEALMREIKLKLEEENRYLREQLDKRAEESGQLRVLLHQSELNVGRLTEKLMSLPGEKPAPWWKFWRLR